MALVNSNPALTKGFERTPAQSLPSRLAGGEAVKDEGVMTISGTVDKTVVSLGLLIAAAAVGWRLADTGIWVAAFFVALVMSFVIAFKPTLAKPLTLVYAVVEGVFVGGISEMFNSQYEGVVLNAAGLTFAIMGVLLFLYRAKIIRPSRNFILGVTAATAGIAVFYLTTIVLGLFGVSMPLVNSNSLWGIGFSVLVVCLASANLVVDFDFIERGAEAGMPKYMEWYGAFGLMVTLVWLYLELLRLLSKLQSRD